MARADGSIVLADFGIAKRLDDPRNRTRHGELYGTPYYVSPEQIEGNPATAQSDIYSLGVIFTEMLTGPPPSGAGSVWGVTPPHVGAPPPGLRGARAGSHPTLD